MNLLGVFERLLRDFGRQNWWPMIRGFKPKEWEVCVGAILTQNTNWKNVEKALENLIKNNVNSPEEILKIKTRKLETLIKPSGFYRQKAKRLKSLANFISEFGTFEKFRKNVKRNELLKVKGIGFETCDSVLLYACDLPYFVIDSYTKRFVKTLGIRTRDDYETLRGYFENSLPKDPELYKEFHALIVEWGKRKGSNGSN
jgi:endonuclease-3 related protein